jgi:tryptophanase
MRWKTIFEPFRIKSVEALPVTTEDERARKIEAIGYNVFLLRAEDVTVDLLTDSGTGAMSAEQWAAVMRGDESYAGSPSFYRFEAVVQRLTGLPFIIPTHQGRAAERILFTLMCRRGDVVPNNTHFDTTRANIEATGAVALDLPCAESRDPDGDEPFKGNMDVDALRAAFAEHGRERIPVVMVTVTNNAGGGQPVSLANLRAVRAVCAEHGRPLYLDACRFAENAYLVKRREPGQGDRSVREIAHEMFGLADGCTMSAKKDGLVNIGGFLATRDPTLARLEKDLLILTEGFPTYGGLAGRDLEAMAVGLEEVLDESYLAYRIRSAEYLGEHLRAAGVPLLWPPGGHAVYLDAARFAPHLAPADLPGIAVCVELYRLAGIRAVEIGTAMFGHSDPTTGGEIPARRELVRLALPRRTYTQSHIDYVVEAIIEAYRRRDDLPAYRIVEQQPALRHFTARFMPVTAAPRPR